MGWGIPYPQGAPAGRAATSQGNLQLPLAFFAPRGADTPVFKIRETHALGKLLHCRNSQSRL